MSKYEIQVEYTYHKIRSWSANILVNGKFYHDSSDEVWVARGRKRKTVIRRAEKKIRKLRHRAELVEKYQYERSRREIEAAELKERFVVGE